MKYYYTWFLSVLIYASFTVGASAQGSASFTTRTLLGIPSLVNPTSLQFGPDGRLYVSQQDGTIYAYTIQKTVQNDYQVTATETILLVKNIPNHNDDGAPNPFVDYRQVTGILVRGTAQNPILWVSSSDPRIGGGGTGGDVNLDTNSGIISKLTWTGSAWTKVDVVIGLPRSEENHAVNGMQLDEVNNILYLAVGGNTNAGAPSNNFAFLCEFALSAAILKIDLNMIESQFGGSYTLPTLDDPTRPNTGPGGSDVNDPFGGNDGLNQAKLVIGGPVQIHAPGFRNAYDLVLTKAPGKEGRIYAVDNGANPGWGGHPDQEGAFGNPLTTNVTNNYVPGEPGSTGPGPNDPQVNNLDGLHLVSTPGMPGKYAGHPNPIRANPAGAGWYWYDNSTATAHFELNPTVDWPPVPLALANPVEGDFRNPGPDNGALHTWPTSTNGITEYTSDKFFSGNMVGDLLVASFDGNIYRIKLTEDGTAAQFVESIASGFGQIPLDVTAQGKDEVFEGTVWVANYASNDIKIFEPEGSWQPINSSDNSLPIARHENGFVELNGKFYLIGGRETTTINIFDPVSRTWTTGANLPFIMHHFQPVTFDGKIYVMGAYKGTFNTGNAGNSESPVEHIYSYDPVANTWTQGATIPRPRGSAGVVVHNNEFYLISGIVNGHHDGWVNWVDKYNPATNTWTILANTPRERDHFHASLINGKIYLAGGRKTNAAGDVFGVTIAEVDVYDIATNTWETLPASANLPTQRAGGSSIVFNNEIYHIGGESLSQVIAHNQCEIFDPISGSWRSGPTLITGRHGTGALVYNNSIFTVAGSGNRGGGPVLNSMEAFASTSACSGDVNNPNLDDDLDCYSNYDETLNGTNPCSAASKPNDFDGDCISDLLDPDDDNDGILDTQDFFAQDASNGMNTNLPLYYPFLNGDPGTGLFGLGFTGLMTNFSDDYMDLYDTKNPGLIMGGAVGIASVPASSGDAKTNNQEYAFQFGFKVVPTNGKLTVKSKLQGTPFFDGIPLAQLQNQTQGIYIGKGDQDNYLKIALAANNGNPGIEIFGENAGSVFINQVTPVANILTSGIVIFYIEVDPVAATAQMYYQTGNDINPIAIGSAIALPSSFNSLLNGTQAMAAGIIASSGNAPSFSASWDYMNITTTVPFVRENAPTFYNKLVGNPTSPFTLNLDGVFDDDNGVGNLTYHFVSVGANSFINNASVSGNTLTITFIGSELGSAMVTVRATDADNLSADYTFLMQVIPPPTVLFQINSGGDEYLTWSEDNYFSGGTEAPPRTNIPIQNTTDDILYQTERWGANFSYQLPVVRAGYYKLNLHFAEIFHGISNSNGVGARVFNVTAEGKTVLSNYDIIREAGGPAIAIVETIDSVFVSDGVVNIQFAAVVENAKISAIELYEYTSGIIQNFPPIVNNPGDQYTYRNQPFSLQIDAYDPDPGDVLQYSATGLPASLTMGLTTGLISGTITANEADYQVTVSVSDGKGGVGQASFKIKVVSPQNYSYRLNAGGPTETFGSEVWNADNYFEGGNTYSNVVPIANTDKDALYQTERYGSVMQYEIPMPGPGQYRVTLHFAEIFWSSPGQRLFSINIESGQAGQTAYDIVQAAGGPNTAKTESYIVNVTDGFLTILLTTVLDQAKVSAIEVAACYADTGVTLSGGTLTASATGATYQWIDCATNTDIPGETGKTFTPDVSGNYAVRVTQNGCTATSSCVPFSIVGLPDDPANLITVYPNPGQSQVRIMLPVHSARVSVDITDTQGRSVMASQAEQTSEVTLDIAGLKKGMYVVHVRADNLKKTIKLVIN